MSCKTILETNTSTKTAIGTWETQESTSISLLRGIGLSIHKELHRKAPLLKVAITRPPVFIRSDRMRGFFPLFVTHVKQGIRSNPILRHSLDRILGGEGTEVNLPKQQSIKEIRLVIVY